MRRRPAIGENVTIGMHGNQRVGAMSGGVLTVAISWCGNVGEMAGTLVGMFFLVRLECVRCFVCNPRLVVGFGAVIIWGALDMHCRGGVVVTLCSP